MKFLKMLMLSSILLVGCSSGSGSGDVPAAITLENYAEDLAFENELDVLPDTAASLFIEGNTMKFIYQDLVDYPDSTIEIMQSISQDEESIKTFTDEMSLQILQLRQVYEFEGDVLVIQEFVKPSGEVYVSFEALITDETIDEALESLAKSLMQ
ncbi:MAG: hypothetical protein ATN35_12955 [Epulopiscium sp. Nele67-Bin004]|nr:MAG: hypothetical protein ATN35_12955 [Epulopiscium sp. Nele67-Bin004]